MRDTIKHRWLPLAAAVCLLLPPSGVAQTPLPGYAPVNVQGDPALSMVDAIHAFLDREIEAAPAKRAALWNGDISPNRERFRKMIGAIDPRVPVTALELNDTTSRGIVAKKRIGI